MPPAKRITVLVVDDHAMVRQGLCALLKADGCFEVVGEAGNGREAVEMERRLRPAVILLDIAMPVLNGLEATRQIFAANPAARVILLSAHSDNTYVESMRAAGVAGFLEKQSSAPLLTKAIRDVADGKTFFSPAIARRLGKVPENHRERHGFFKANGARLTSRESEVLQLVAEGAANKQIAVELGISSKTVEKHRQRLMDKLGIHDTAGLTRYAIAAGVIESSVQVTIV